jgi:membrane complex biogenesis BtpA family protein
MSIVRTGWIAEVKPAIGMVHLGPLPGSPNSQEPLSQMVVAALRDAEALIEEGMDGLLIENWGDTPFFPDRVPPITISSMTAVVIELRRRFQVPLGVNVLRNDARAALAIAAAAGANFIRVNILCGARVTDQGIVQGQAHELLRERRQWAADDIQIWADIQVKHSGPLAPRTLQEEAVETIQRGHADAVIVTGPATGRSVSPETLSQVQQVAAGTPVVVGSGVTADNVADWLPLADGLIVGSSLKEQGRADRPVDRTAVRRFVEALRGRRA